MKILKISDVYFPRINGVSTSIATFRRELTARGHEVTLVAPAYGAAENGNGVVRVAARSVPFDREDRLMRLGALRRRAAAVAPGEVDLVHVHTPFLAHRFGVRLARRLRVPVVETYHTFFEEYFHHYVGFLPQAALRWTARRFSRSQCEAVDRILVPSPAMGDVLVEYGVRTPTEVVPTGIDFGELSNGDGGRFRARHGIAAGRPTLVHVGRVAFEKNIEFLFEVTARVRDSVPEVLLIVAGEGPAMASLRRLATRLDLAGNVLFTGYLSRDRDLQDCYRAGDLFIFASRTETQGLVLLEALALGVPVVSTAVMGTRSIVAPERGAVRAEEEAGDFAAKVGALLRDPDRRRRLAQEGREFARDWSSEVMAGRLESVYERALATHRPSRGA